MLFIKQMEQLINFNWQNKPMNFEHNIFINCPFDDDFKPILKVLIFGCVYLGYKPLLSETINSAESRVIGIKNLISQAKYSLHDLSRMKSSKKDELARFNMPFELGLDIGCRYFGSSQQQEKYLLILDSEKYRYQKAISDLSGNDIETHQDSPEKALRKFRNWIFKIKNTPIDSANKIWRLYNEFNGDFFEIIVNSHELSQEDINDMPWDEFCYHINEWITGREAFKKKLN